MLIERDLKEIYSIFEQLKSTNGKNDKINILQQNKNNKLLQKILKFVYSTNILTGLSDKKINKVLNNNYIYKNFKDIEEVMDYLQNNFTGTDEIIYNIQSFISSVCDDNIKEMCKDIFTKSLKLGCDTKTFNKVFGKDFIKEHEVQQAYSIEKYKLKPNEWFSLSVKQNGCRGSYLDGKIVSRQGIEIIGLQHIINDIEALGLSSYFIDGELQRKNIDNLSDNENFRIGTGIINNDDISKEEIEFVIFDLMPLEEFNNGESKLKYKQRQKILFDIKENININALQNIKIVDVLYDGINQDMIEILLNKVTTQDKEGLMLNRDVTYKCKRHNGILKIKKFYTMDLKVIDYEEGNGRLQNTLGALIVDFNGNRVNVGSGYDDETRKSIWNVKEFITGRIIEVKYKEVSKDKTGKESLQFPIFVGFREVGKKVSYD